MAALESAISLPFSLDVYGNIAKTTDQSKIWADRVRGVIGTMSRERVMTHAFGTQIPLSVFQNTDVAQEAIRKEIFTAFTAYLSALTLEDVSVSFDEGSDTILVELSYSLPNKEVVTTSIGVASISGTKIISEDLR